MRCQWSLQCYMELHSVIMYSACVPALRNKIKQVVYVVEGQNVGMEWYYEV